MLQRKSDMPCLTPSYDEIEKEYYSGIQCMLDEVNGIKFHESWRRSHPSLKGNIDYGALSHLVPDLCAHLKANGSDQYSDHVKNWWVKHQEDDRFREKQKAEYDATSRAEFEAKKERIK